MKPEQNSPPSFRLSSDVLVKLNEWNSFVLSTFENDLKTRSSVKEILCQWKLKALKHTLRKLCLPIALSLSLLSRLQSIERLDNISEECAWFV